MNILIDAVILQYAAPSSAAAQACRAILSELATEASLTILDRGGDPHVDGTRVIAFPTFRNATPAADAFLAQRLCDQLGIGVFVSTGFTTPIAVPTLQLLIGEDLTLFDRSRGDAASRVDCEIALAFSTYLVCTTETMEAACRKQYPKLADARLPRTEEAPRPAGKPCVDRVQATASRVLDLSRRAMTRDTVVKQPEFLERWRRIREIQAAIEVS